MISNGRPTCILADPSVRQLPSLGGDEVVFSTEELLECERAIIGSAERRQGERTAILSRSDGRACARGIGAQRGPSSGGQGVGKQRAGRGDGPGTRRNREDNDAPRARRRLHAGRGDGVRSGTDRARRPGTSRPPPRSTPALCTCWPGCLTSAVGFRAAACCSWTRPGWPGPGSPPGCSRMPNGPG